MHPVLFEFIVRGNVLSVGSYTFFISLALIGGTAAMWLIMNRRGVRPRRAALFVLLTTLAFIVGARLLYVFTHPAVYRQGAVVFLMPTPNHFSIYGGLAAMAVTAILLARRLDLPVLRTADAAVPVLGGAIVLAKLGCLLNGCCSGRASALPWAVTLTGREVHVPAAAAVGGLSALVKSALADPIPTHPIAAYEILAVLVAVGLCMILGRNRPAGFKFAVFAAAFTAGRLAIYPLRAGQLPFETIFYPALYSAVIILAFVLIVKKRGRSESFAPFAPNTM